MNLHALEHHLLQYLTVDLMNYFRIYIFTFRIIGVLN